MTDSSEARRGRSARHYLLGDQLAARLQPTVVLAARALGFPTAMVNILDEDDQYTVGGMGLDSPSSSPVPRSLAMCDAVVRSGKPVVVEDAAADARFASLEWVRDGSVSSYVGIPLVSRESVVVGTVCVVDSAHRSIDADQVNRLAGFGKVVEDQLDLVRRLREQRRDGQVAAGELAEALRSGAIVPWYQPVLDLRSGDIVGFEALARWVDGGTVRQPNSFIPLAEDSDLILELDHLIMRLALIDLARWQLVSPGLEMSVNLSSRHFDQHGWIEPLIAAVAAAGVRPQSVKLELTETSRLSAGHHDGAFVGQLQDHGFAVWLDDFGTGWSSMEYLLQLPADGVKIDRVITVALGTHVGNTLIRSITELAHQLGMRITIEGIETAQDADLATGLGCDYAQGFLSAEPRPSAAIDSALQGRWAPAQSGGLPFGGRAEWFATRAAVPRTGATAMSLHPALAEAVLDSLPDAVAVVDGNGRIVTTNDAWRVRVPFDTNDEPSLGVGVSYLDICDRSAIRGSADARQMAADLRAVLTGTQLRSQRQYACPPPAVDRSFLLRIVGLAGRHAGAVVSFVDVN